MATLTIEIPNNQIPRIQDAFAFAYGLGSPSSQVDVEFIKQYVIQDLQQFTRNAEQRKAATTAIAAIGSPQDIKLQSV